ncbi:MAG: zinc-ribbon domain-containing protein [Acidobacteriota bacterium]
MFCPNCGSEERQVSQFCRACGTDMRAVRVSLEKPDAITASAVSARDEIGHAIADRIRELKKAGDLSKVAQEVLPQIEKFLEAPQQRRLRGIREGVVTSAIGLGVTVFFLVWGLNEEKMLFLTGLGVTCFLIGLGLIINALLFTVPKQYVPQHSLDNRQTDLIDEAPDRVIAVKRELTTAEPLSTPPSVPEQTTHHLTDSPAAPARVRESD